MKVSIPFMRQILLNFLRCALPFLCLCIYTYYAYTHTYSLITNGLSYTWGCSFIWESFKHFHIGTFRSMSVVFTNAWYSIKIFKICTIWWIFNLVYFFKECYLVINKGFPGEFQKLGRNYHILPKLKEE